MSWRTCACGCAVMTYELFRAAAAAVRLTGLAHANWVCASSRKQHRQLSDRCFLPERPDAGVPLQWLLITLHCANQDLM
jgi:hypothetical protein